VISPCNSIVWERLFALLTFDATVGSGRQKSQRNRKYSNVIATCENMLRDVGR